MKFRVTPLSGLYSKILIGYSPIACCTYGAVDGNNSIICA
jgi:hypothetical protein